ncbi:hypothetical protein B0H10DRAFT_2188381 [Mycena sp. CBHHK59/15]|nr:hypothetical protein B0H10DRAFT_2188381 [Mycena sp. CBHHK59/15]
MPATGIASTVIRAASSHCRLSLSAIHHLSSDFHDGSTGKTRFPDDIDVVLASELVFTLSSVHNGVKVSSADILKSQLAQHMVDYFQANATELGMNTVSSMYIDGDDGLPKLKLVPSCCFIPSCEIPRVHVTLVAIDLNYIWHTSKSDSELVSNSLVHPFSTHLSLPFQMLLDNVLRRFVTWHLVRRYPLIFGPWCQQLEIEKPYFDKIFRSISNIIQRSPRLSFRKNCERMIRTMQEQHAATLSAATVSLATYFGSDDDACEPADGFREPALNDEEAFCLSMELRYRTSMHRPQFKGSTRMLRADGSDDDELSQDLSLLTPDCSQRFDENFLWHDPTPSATLSDYKFDFDVPLICFPSPGSNIEQSCAMDLGLEIEYQEDPSEIWSDIDVDELLSLTSDDEPEHSAMARPEPCFHSKASVEDGSIFAFISPLEPPRHSRDLTDSNRHFRSHDLPLDWNVNTNTKATDASHADGSPDFPLYLSDLGEIQSISPPATSGLAFRQGTAEFSFPGLSTKQATKHCLEDTKTDLDLPQTPITASASDDLDLEMFFDSDSDSHNLEQFDDNDEAFSGVGHLLTLANTCPGPDLERALEHQAEDSNGKATDVGVNGAFF